MVEEERVRDKRKKSEFMIYCLYVNQTTASGEVKQRSKTKQRHKPPSLPHPHQCTLVTPLLIFQRKYGVEEMKEGRGRKEGRKEGGKAGKREARQERRKEGRDFYCR